MAKSSLKFVATMTAVAIVSSVITVDATQDNACNAYGEFQFNSIEILDQLIEEIIASTLKNKTGE